MITKIKEEWYCVEIKRQERFMPPPFEGQGLPKWQIEDRLKFQKETGIRCMFFVVEKPTENILWNYLDNLYNAEKYQTKGDKPRIIFPIVNFKKINLVG